MRAARYRMRGLIMNTLYFETQALETKLDLLPWQKQGLQYTATGYGGKIPTQC